MCANYKAPMGGLGSPDSAQGERGEPSSPVAEALQDDPAAKIKYLNDNFCRHLADFINAFNNVFLGALSTKPGLPVPPLSQREKRAAEEDLTSSVADLARDYFGLVELFLKPQENRLSSPANYATMFVRMESTIATLDRLVPKYACADDQRVCAV